MLRRLDPDKLTVDYRPYVTKRNPIIPRRYTLTHSDITAELFLTISSYYAYDKVTSMRDEVLAEWRMINNQFVLWVYVFVDGGSNTGPMMSYIRNKIFIKELPLALKAIRYGDQPFFQAHPFLDNASVMIHFDSKYHYFNRIEFWGFPYLYIPN